MLEFHEDFAREAVASLTPRETDVAMMIAEGMHPEEMAKATHNKVATIRTHIRNILVKLGTTSQLETAVVIWKLRAGTFCIVKEA